jgi:hypothetical protein
MTQVMKFASQVAVQRKLFASTSWSSWSVLFLWMRKSMSARHRRQEAPQQNPVSGISDIQKIAEFTEPLCTE